jgi:polyisoprenoid-binding protein YceI
MIRSPGIAAILGATLTAAVLCTPVAAATIHFRVDPNATQIVASVKEPLARIRGAASGTFTVIDGTIEGDPADPVNTGRIAITFDATSYKSGSAYRDKRVTRDALDAEHFPVVRFVSTRIEDFAWVSQNVEAIATIVGNLTLHGVTREVRIPIDATLSPDKKLLSTDGDVNFTMSDFGIEQPSTLFGALRTGRKVDLNFRVVAVPVDQAIATPTPK